MTVYERIKKRRKELKMSQEKLAKMVGYSDRSGIAWVEAGRFDLPQSKLEKIAAALQTTPAYLMGWIDEMEQQLVDDFHSLNDEGKDKLCDYARDLRLSGAYKKHGSDEMVDQA